MNSGNQHAQTVTHHSFLDRASEEADAQREEGKKADGLIAPWKALNGMVHIPRLQREIESANALRLNKGKPHDAFR
ncbi:hypothetical protein [Paraburkholderia sp. J69-1]|uniref:hypothetical protein n=1 Tax=Paraburkholderia sp. J69-1 TaxID=2805436 RepID=UPI002AB7E45F|nr:hypothetical protein [Paraburkholderia sp. J69-1]